MSRSESDEPILELADRGADDVDLVATPDGGELWVCWSAATLDQERVQLARWRAGEVTIVRLPFVDRAGGGPSDAFRPRLALCGDDVVIAAVVLLDDGRTRLDVARVERVSARVRESWHCDEPGACVFDLALCPHLASPGSAWLACDVRQGRRSSLRVGRLDPGGVWLDVALPRPRGLVPWRRTPALAARPDGGAWLAWVEGPDVRNGPGHVHLASLAPEGTLGPIVRPDPHPAHQEAPALAALPGGEALVAWHTGAVRDPDDGGDDDDVLRWLRAARVTHGLASSAPRVAGGEAARVTAHDLVVPPRPEPTRETCGEDQGWEFPCLAAASDTLWLAARSAHGFHASFAGRDGAFGERLALSPPGWGGRGRRCALAGLADGSALFARRESDGVVVSRLGRGTPQAGASAQPEPDRTSAPTSASLDSGAPARPEPDPSAAPTSASLGSGTPAARRAPLHRVRGRDPARPVWFGDLHQHSVHSDATGAPEELLRAARDRYGHDFAALTDHDLFCRRAIGPATWTHQCAVADALDEPGRFVVLRAYEFTGARLPGPGHKCVYFGESVPARLPEKTIDALQAMLREHGALAIPHHLGFTGADMAHHDPALQPCFELCSVHGVYERDDLATRFPPRDDVRLPGQSIADCLAAGLRFGFVGGTDSHGLLWHHGVSPRRDPYRCGLTALVGAELTRAGVLAALRERRCYATTGARIALHVELDGALMGSQLPPGTRGTLRVEAEGTARIVRASLVRRAGELALPVDGARCEASIVLEPGDDDFAYVRIEQGDGELAWSSPLFWR